MPIDPSIALGVRPLEVPNQMAQYAQMAQIENAQNQSRAAANQNALAQFQLSAAQRAETGQNALGQAWGNYFGGGPGYEPGTSPPAKPGEPVPRSMRQAILGQLATSAPHLIPDQLAKFNAMDKAELDAQKTRVELATSRTAQYRDMLTGVKTPEAGAQWLAAQYKDPLMASIVSQVPLEQALKEIPTDPKEFSTWLSKNSMGMAKFIEQNKPQLSTKDTGSQIIDRTFSPLTNKIENVGTTAKTATPGEILRHQDAMARLAAESATGKLTPESIDLAAQLYAQTGTLPPLGIGKAAAGLKTQILNRASELTMGGGTSAADAASKLISTKQDVQSASKAVKDFSTGLQSRQVTSFNTAIDHLATMDKLADALANNDVKVFNTVANAFARQTGSPAPTNFDTAKTIVASEVAKAVSGSSMALKDRDEIRDQILAARSPEQLKGATDTLKKLLGGQLNSLNLQYENSTGRKDFDKKLTPESQKTIKELRGGSNAAPANSGGFKYLGKE